MKKENGITLIALVITIIVLLILAGVTINLTLGQNGIFKTAEQAAKNYKEAENKELGALAGFTNEINNIANPLPIGTIIKTENGINYMADGAGNTIPVPKGFKALEGTKYTGFVIRNEEDDNEFVWVPVEGMSYSYERHDFGKQDGSYSNYSEILPTDEQTSVATYGGYYIGRYEAGIEGGTLSSSDNLENSKIWTGYTGDNMKLVVKPGAEVWNYITRDKAIAVATGLYNKTEDNIVSKLCSSYAWDTALQFIATQSRNYPSDSAGGYYGQSAPTTTGNNTVHPCNIYDMGGNVWEWTTESFNNTSAPCTRRGGSYKTTSTEHPSSYRTNNSDTVGYANVAFRVVLFM